MKNIKQWAKSLTNEAKLTIHLVCTILLMTFGTYFILSGIDFYIYLAFSLLIFYAIFTVWFAYQKDGERVNK